MSLICKVFAILTMASPYRWNSLLRRVSRWNVREDHESSEHARLPRWRRNVSRGERSNLRLSFRQVHTELFCFYYNAMNDCVLHGLWAANRQLDSCLCRETRVPTISPNKYASNVYFGKHQSRLTNIPSHLTCCMVGLKSASILGWNQTFGIKKINLFSIRHQVEVAWKGYVPSLWTLPLGRDYFLFTLVTPPLRVLKHWFFFLLHREAFQIFFLALLFIYLFSHSLHSHTHIHTQVVPFT